MRLYGIQITVLAILVCCCHHYPVESTDNEAPSVTCPDGVPSISVDPGTAVSTVSWSPSPSAVDIVDGNVTDNVVCKDNIGNVVVSGDRYAVGLTTVTCRANDTALNEGLCQFSILVDGCSATFTAPTGMIKIPTHSGRYTNDLDCRLLITLRTSVRLTFLSIDIETASEGCYDYVNVYDGVNIADSSLLTHLCGTNNITYGVVSSGTSMLVHFVSDNSNGYYGFVAVYEEVIDLEPPRFTDCENITTTSFFNDSFAYVQVYHPNATDNSGGSVTIECPGSTEGLLRFSIGDSYISCIAKDIFNNIAMCNRTVTVKDLEPPRFTDCENITTTSFFNDSFAYVQVYHPNATDNSGGSVTIECPGSTEGLLRFSIGDSYISCIAKDIFNNTAMCNRTVTVKDLEPPRFTDCENITTTSFFNDSFAYVQVYQPNATDNSGGSVTIECPGSTEGLLQFSIGESDILCIAKDMCNNTAMCHRTVTVKDLELPRFTDCENITTTSFFNDSFAYVQVYQPNATDNSGGSVTIECPGSTEGLLHFSIGDSDISCIAKDIYNNIAMCHRTVTVEDNEDPRITCPENQSLFADVSKNYATVALSPPDAALDNSEVVNVSIVIDKLAYLVGDSIRLNLSVTPHRLQFIVRDSSHNNATCDVFISVEDNEKPKITCPENVRNTTLDNLPNGEVFWQLPNATDNSLLPIMPVKDHPSGSLFPIGVHTVYYNATDAMGNSNNCSFTVTIVDEYPPQFLDCRDIVKGTDTGVASTFVTFLEPNATDNSGGSVTVNCTSVIQATGQVVIVGTYGVHCNAYDQFGNEGVCRFNVKVIDDDPPTFAGCPSDFTVHVGSQTETALVRWTPPVATDNLGAVNVTSNIQPNSRLSPPGNMVVYTGIDTAHLQGICEFSVTVNVATTGIMKYQLTVIMSAINGMSGSEVSVLIQNLADDLEDLLRIPGNPLAVLIVTISPVRHRFTSNNIIVEMEMTMNVSNLSPSMIEQAFDDLAPWNQFPTGNVVLGNTFTVGPGGCTSSNVCMNGGSCRPGRAGFYVCDCTEAYTGTDCSTDADECAIATNTLFCVSQGLSCYNYPGSFSCDCPVGYWRNGDSGFCSKGKVFRLSITILTWNKQDAVFANDMLDSTSTRYVILRSEVEIAAYDMLIALQGYEFVQVRLYSFSPGSIIPNLIVTVDQNSPVTQEKVQADLNQAVSNNNHNIGSSMVAAPQSTNVIEEVCMADYCMNGGACSTDHSTFASSCSCAAGFTGARCQTASTDDGTGGGDGVSDGDIIAIVMGGAVLLIITFMVILGFCFFMSRASSSRTKAMYGRDNYQYHYNQRRQENRDRYYTRGDLEYKMNSGQFSIPYIATGNEVFPMNRPAKIPRRGDTDYF